MRISAKLCTLVIFVASAKERPGDWSGDYPPCDGHVEIAKSASLNFGVRFSTVRRDLAVEFARAMDYWASLLDLEWHVVEDRSCAIQVVDGADGLFQQGQVARAQFPGSPSFQGWIAFNPARPLTANQLFVAAVHELGHIFGLPHSPNGRSVMYFLQMDDPLFLDDEDLRILASRHKLRQRRQLVPTSVLYVTREVSPTQQSHDDAAQSGRVPLAVGRLGQFRDRPSDFGHRGIGSSPIK